MTGIAVTTPKLLGVMAWKMTGGGGETRGLVRRPKDTGIRI